MAWTSPRTWVTGEIVTAANMNVHVRDNLSDLDRRTSPGAGGPSAASGTSSLTFVDLSTSVAVSQTIGANGRALVAIYANLSNTALEATLLSYRVSGGITHGSDDDRAVSYTPGVANVGARIGATFLHGALAAGQSHTFTTQGRSTSSSSTANFDDMRIAVTALGS